MAEPGIELNQTLHTSQDNQTNIATHNGNVHTSHSEDYDWVSWKLKLPCFVAMILVEIAIITTLIVTLILSERNNGIATVNTSDSLNISNNIFSATIRNPSSAYSLLWTSLPSFILSVFQLFWGIIVVEFGVRQPFVTLFQGGGSARKTILLDYHFDGDIWKAWRILKNKHWSFLFATILNLVLMVIIVPLSSHVYQLRSTFFTSMVSLTFSHSFDDNINGTPDLIGPFSLASAINTYGSTPPPWMDSLYAYPPFSGSLIPSNGSIKVNTTAYSALLDCQIMGPDDYTSIISGNSTFLNINDRGCTSRQEAIPGQPSQILCTVYHEPGCTQDAQYSRIGLLAGAFTPALINFTVVSCIPTYWTSDGIIDVSLRLNAEPLVSSYQNTTEWIPSRPFYSTSFEDNLAQYNVIDPILHLQANQFGSITYQYANTKNPNKPLDSATLMRGMEDLFASIHAAYALTDLFIPAQSKLIPGTLSQSISRVFVVPITAIILIILMVLIMISNVQLYSKTKLDKTMLSEEPIGLLAAASLTSDPGSHNNTNIEGNSDSITDFVRKFRQDNPGAKTIREKVLKEYDVDNSFCSYDSSTGVIRVESLVRRRNLHPEVVKQRKRWFSRGYHSVQT
jgi:Protein of unknown function (DUF3433)